MAGPLQKGLYHGELQARYPGRARPSRGDFPSRWAPFGRVSA